MSGEDSSRPPARCEVHDPLQARLLTHPVSKEFFKPFLARERTVSQAAAELGRSVSATHYRVKTFLRAGLLYVAREEKRSGRPVKHYRSAHDAYFVPSDKTPYAGLEERLSAQFGPFWQDVMQRLARAYRENGWDDGQSMYRGEDGTVWTNYAADFFKDPVLENFRFPVVLYRDVTAQLTREEAVELQRTLNELIERSLENQKQGKPYTLQLALVPLN